MFTIIFVCFTFQAYGYTLQAASLRESSDARSARIVGGSLAKLGEAPYHVSLRTSSNVHYCGGTILDQTTIMTAAHCVRGIPTSVVVGTNNRLKGGIRYRIGSIIVHENYTGTNNDLGLLKLSQKIQYNEYVQPIKLPDKDTGAGEKVMLVGWGTTNFSDEYISPEPVYLQAINLTTLKLECCQEYFSVSSSHICTYNRKGEGPCFGDSGGALVINGIVAVGVVSRGIPCAQGIPDVSTNVYYFRKWIESKISYSCKDGWTR